MVEHFFAHFRMERLHTDLPGEVRDLLGPDYRGIADDLDIFLSDHPEIESISQLSDAIRAKINEVGGFQFYTKNPKTERVFPGIKAHEGVTMIVSKELTDQTLAKLKNVIPDQLS